MHEQILHFPEQFGYKPEIIGWKYSKPFARYIVVGMGGSSLSADLLRTYNPILDLRVHRDYGLPEMDDSILRESLVIVISYSGNTEEAISGYQQAKEKNIPLVAISQGGQLLELAKKDGVPFVELSSTGIQPRSARGYMFQALLEVTGQESVLDETIGLQKTLNTGEYELRGKEIAGRLGGLVPLIYASRKNIAVAYNWKISMNETGKIPAFCNALPEVNHNEMAGFSSKVSKKFYFIFLKDLSDHPRILRRMEILEGVYRAAGMNGEVVEMTGESALVKIFSTVLVGDFAAYHTALAMGDDPEKVSIIEDFKKQLS